MPLYEYECEAGHRFELIQKFSDPPADTCPVCGKTVTKLQSAPAFQFKGSGWYITDYARKGQKSDDKSETKSSGKSEGSSQSSNGEQKSESSSASEVKSGSAPSTTDAVKPSPSPASDSSSQKKP